MKRIINKNIILMVTLTLLSAMGSAQTLRELINTALANNYQIQILENQTQMAENSNTIGNSGQLPTVSMSGGISTASNNTRQELANGTVNQGANAQTSNMNLSLLANWTAFDGLGVYARKDQLEYLQQMGELNARFYIEQTVADVAAAYYQLVYEKQVLVNQQLSMNISRYRLTVEEKRKTVGSGTKLQYGQALVDYNTDSINYMAQQANIRSLEIELNRLLNIDLEKTLTITEGEILFEPIPKKDSLFAQTQKRNAQLESYMLSELIAESALRIEKANRYPKINIYGGYQFTQSQAEVGFILRNQNVGPVIGMNISFNLYNAGRTNIAVKNALLESENSELSTKQLNTDLNAQLLDLYNQYESMTNQISLAKVNVETMEQVYSVAAEQLSKGDINGYDFRLTQLALFNAQIGLKRLEFGLKLIEIGLHRITGDVVDTYL